MIELKYGRTPTDDEQREVEEIREKFAACYPGEQVDHEKAAKIIAALGGLLRDAVLNTYGKRSAEIWDELSRFHRRLIDVTVAEYEAKESPKH